MMITWDQIIKILTPIAAMATPFVLLAIYAAYHLFMSDWHAYDPED